MDRPVDPASDRPRRTEPSLGARFVLLTVALYGALALGYPIGWVLLAVGNALAWHHHGYLDSHLTPALGSAVFGIVCLVPGAALLAGGGSGSGCVAVRARAVCARAGVGSWSLCLLGLVAATYGQWMLWQALWFDMTFIDEGHIGASFSMLAVWCAQILLLPVAAVLLGGGLAAAGDGEAGEGNRGR